MKTPETYAAGRRLGLDLRQKKRDGELTEADREEARTAFLGAEGAARQAMARYAGFINGIELPRRPFPWDDDYPL